jgi:hypothetical protein
MLKLFSITFRRQELCLRWTCGFVHANVCRHKDGKLAHRETEMKYVENSTIVSFTHADIDSEDGIV